MLILYATLALMGLTISVFLYVLISARRKTKSQQVFARTPSGCSLTIDIDDLNFVGELREAIQDRLQFWKNFRLSFKGKNLDDQKTLRDYNIMPGCTIFVLGRLRGGPLSTSDFMFKSLHHPVLSTPTASKHLKKVPGMTKPDVYDRIYSELQSGCFYLKDWFQGLGSRTKSNLKKKRCEIYWGGESLIGVEYSCGTMESELIESFDISSCDVNDDVLVDSIIEQASAFLTCSERDLREFEVLDFKIFNLHDITRAKQLQIIPFYSEWSSNSKLWSQMTTNPDFSLLDIVDFKEDKKNLFFERLEKKKLILRLEDFILGHPENITKIYKIGSKGKKRDRMRMESTESIEDAETAIRDNLTKVFEITFDASQKQIEKWTSNLLGDTYALRQTLCVFAGWRWRL